MLLTKTVILKWNSKIKKHYVSKGYVFTKIGDELEVKIEDLSIGCNVKIDVKCDECGDISNVRWNNYSRTVKEDGKTYCNKCSVKLYSGENLRKALLKKNGKSFYDWCYENLLQEKADEIISRWDEKLNNCSPKDVCYRSHKKYYLKCPLGLHDSELKNIYTFTYGYFGSNNCLQCNSIAVTHPEYIKYFVNIEDTYKYSHGSSKKVKMKCPDCGFVKNFAISALTTRGFTCPKCCDGISYPNKIAFNLLEQLDLNFIPEYSPDWIRPKRYDFYFEANNQKYILEMDGGFHIKNNSMSKQTVMESILLDNYKDELALNHNIEVIRIDCRDSELEYIKNNILNSKLAELFNLSNIDWLKCHEYACSSLVKITCDLWNMGFSNTTEISHKLKKSISTVTRYLKQGEKLGLCNYNGGIKKIICLNNKTIFKSVKEANEVMNIKMDIRNCCRGETKSSGKHPKTGEPLRWMYYEDYIKQQKQNLNAS